MAEKKVSVKRTARDAVRADAKERKAKKFKAGDSFVNFAQRLGVGADNALSTAGYGFNPITRIRVMLEWIHRGSWLGGVAVDVVAEDMTRAGVELTGQLKPESIAKIEEAAVTLGIWNKLQATVKWSRLYGGAIAVLLVDGQDVSTPLRLEMVGKGQFKGLQVLDRWMVEPSLNNLITDLGPHLGLPKFYTVTNDAPALRAKRIHYSRCIRLDGVELPYWQRIQENLWGCSVLERLYDRMIAFDSATTGMAQLIYKAYIRTYKVKDLRDIVSQSGPALTGLVNYVEMMRRFQGMEGITLLDSEDEMEAMGTSAFSGLAEALRELGQQLSGALQIPLVRLFGQSPSGFNSGDTDVRMYYDGVKQQQEKDLKVPVTTVYRLIGKSEGIKLPDGFGTKFRPLWQLTDEAKATVSEVVTRAVVQAEEAGLISQAGAMKELRQQSTVTGVFSNIKDEDIEQADEELPPAGTEALELAAKASKENAEAAGGGEESMEDASNECNAAMEKFRAASAVWRKAQSDCRARVTGDKEFLAARAIFQAAEREADAAEMKEIKKGGVGE